MVLDSSALVALLFDEPEAETFRREVEDDPTRLVSAATLLEAALIVEGRKGDAAGHQLDLLLHKADVIVTPVDAEQIGEARRAYRRFGRGRHEAALTYGDTFAYALARITGEPLLFKTGRFAKTDIRRVV